MASGPVCGPSRGGTEYVIDRKFEIGDLGPLRSASAGTIGAAVGKRPSHPCIPPRCHVGDGEKKPGATQPGPGNITEGVPVKGTLGPLTRKR